MAKKAEKVVKPVTSKTFRVRDKKYKKIGDRWHVWGKNALGGEVWRKCPPNATTVVAILESKLAG